MSTPQPVEPMTLTTADGYRLAALRYDPPHASRGHLIVAGATGTPQRFYRRFAEYAAAQGFTVLTFDYRGIGLSKPKTLKGFQASYTDWGRLDLAAAVDAMSDGNTPLYMVGHSFGGHAFGLLPNHACVERFYVYGVGAGWHGWMPRLEGLRVRFAWKVLLPLLTRWKGYMPSKLLGMGENLPMGVYRQWRRWCEFPHYFFDDPDAAELTYQFPRVHTPIIAANALDDAWAPPRSRDAFMQGYRNAPVETVDLDPRGGLGAIGHFGYFRPQAQSLWDETLAWFLRPDARAA